jgi:endonuclease/exonuclease/phosphatase family metal-dependent hydrolase
MMNLFNLFATRPLRASTSSTGSGSSRSPLRRLSIALLISAVLAAPLSASAATILTESFETDGDGTRYTSTGEQSDNSEDYYGRQSSSSTAVTLYSGDGTYWWGGQDQDGDGGNNPATITFTSLDITGYTDLELLSLWAEDQDGGNEDWDAADYVHVAYSIDGGSFTELLWFESESTGSNGEPGEDTDRNGVADGRNVTDTFQEWTNSISGTGTGLVIRVISSMNSGDEDWAMDNLRITGTASASCTSYSTALYDRGTPDATYTLGDMLTNVFEFAINVDTTGWTVDYGVGKTTDGSSWTWRSAAWSYYSDPNRVWKSVGSEQRFDSTGSWYYAGRLTTGSCTYYADVDWEATTGGGLSAGSYFTVNAINNPSSQAAITNTADPVTEIDLSWAKNAQGHNVMIVRKLSTDSWTEPTQGTAYSASDSLGDGTVIYNSSGTAFTDTSLTGGVTYDYKFYSENWSYYSSGLTAQETTLDCTPSAPTGLYVNPTNSTTFTANWDAMPPATNYYIDVSTNSEFGGVGGGGGVQLGEQFDSGLAASYTTGDQTLTSGVWGCVSVFQENTYPRSGYAARINDDTANASIYTPELDTAGTVTFWYRAYSQTGTFNVQKSYNESTWENVSTQYFDNLTYAEYSVDVDDSASSIYIRILNDDNVGHLCVDDFEVTSYASGSPDFVPGFSNLLVGASTSVSVTGLTAGVTYYWRVRAEGPGACISEGSTTNSVTCPSIAAPTLTSPTATAIGQTGATLGANITVGASLTERGTVWGTSANPTGNDLDEGGTSTGVFTDGRTGLSQGTKYFYRGYAINGGGTSYSPDGSFYTEPGQASGISFSSVASGGMTISWTAGANSDGSIVVVREASGTISDPTDGTLHSASATFSSGADLGSGSYVVYRGSLETVDITGLTPNTTYYVEVFAYKGTVADSGVDQGINYRQTSPLTGNQLTADYPTARWTALYNRGTPVTSYYVGDSLAYIFEFAVNTPTDNWTIDYGVGTTMDGSGWEWNSAAWSRDDGANRVWKSVADDVQFTSAGTYYYAGRMVTNAYTYYADRDWATDPDNLTLAASNYFTVAALGAPTSPTAITNTANSATRADLGWAQWSGRNVLITYSTAAASGSPVQGTSYSASDTFGNQTVVSGSQGGTSLTVSGLTPGETYYFTFYSENFDYYSAGVSATSITMSQPRAQNTSGGGSPEEPATIYLGDTNQVFGLDAWGNLDGQWGQGRLWVRQGNADISGGTAGPWAGYINQDHNAVTSLQFTAVGDWYWGIQMDYSSYGTAFWYKDSSASWVDLDTDGTGASLSVTVSAINNPGSQSATVDAVNYTSEIDLSWAQNAQSHNVMVVRKLSTDSWTEPVQGTAYSVSDPLGDGTVIYNGSGLAFSDTGLTEDTTYDYKFYSENWSYYSAGVTDQEATLACEPVPPATLWASVTNSSDFTAAWSASVGATNYFLDVSTNAAFGTSSGSDTNLIISEMCDPSADYAANRYIEIFNAGSASVDLTGWSVVATANDGSDYFTWTLSGTIASSNAMTCGDSSNTQFTPDFTGGSWNGGNASWNGKVGDGAYLKDGSTTIDQASTHGNFENKTTVRAAVVGTGVTVFASGEWTSTAVTDAGSGASTPGSHVCSSVPSGGGGSTPDYVLGYSNRLTGAGTTFSVTGLTGSVTYYFRLRGQGTGGCTGGNSTTQNVTTIGGAPSAPTGVSASDGTSQTQVDVTWNDPGTETGFVIWRHTADVFGSATAIYTNAADDVTYSDTAVAPLDVYYYWVTATNAIGSSAASSSDTGYAGGYELRYNGFEGTDSDNWSWVPTAGTGEIGPRDDTTLTGMTGDYAVMLRGSDDGSANPSILFDNVALPASCANISLSIGYAADGADSDDDLYLDVSYDNGSTWGVSTQLVGGFSSLDVNFGETVADRTAGANPYIVTVPDDTAQVRVRIRYTEQAADNSFDRFYIDELKLTAGCDLPTVAFDTSRTVTNETSGTITIPVTISSASDATVRVAIAGTALPGGTDFTATTTNLVFTSGGSTSVDLEIAIVDDTNAEGPESVRFTLTQADGCRVAGPDIHSLFIRDDDAFSVLSANLVSGTVVVNGETAYDDAGQNLLKALCPDVVAIQEWVVTNSFAQFVTDNFGADFYYVTDGTTGLNALPNGIISRWPIVDTNIWDDAVGYREHLHAEIDLPGSKNLNIVSVHLDAGDTAGDIANRILGARNLTNAIEQAGFAAGDYLLIAGDLNTTNRSATELSVLTSIVSDAYKPTDKAGNEETNPSKARPYDYVLPDSALEVQYVGMSYNGTSFADGLIFDTREWGDHQYPALGSDSDAQNLTHSPVVKVFSLGEIVEPPIAFTATASAVDQIDLAFTTNASGDNLVIVYNTTGTFTDPVGAPPAAGNAFASGTVVYRGNGSSYNHTGLDSCETYYYSAWSYSGTPVFSSALTDDATTDSPAAPATVWASATNSYDFTADWSASTGATGYRIDVSTNSDFGGGAAANLVDNPGFETGDSTDWDVFPADYSVETTDPNNGTYSAFCDRPSATAAMSQEVPITGDGVTEYEISFYYKVIDGDGSDVRMWSSWTSGGQDSGDTIADSTYLQSATWVKKTYNVVPSSGANVLHFEIRNYSTAEAYFDDFFVGQSGGGAPSYVAGYSNRTVGATSVSVTNLTDSITYYFRVRAEGASCTSDNSPTGSVTTVVGPPPVPTGLAASDGTSTAQVALSWNDLGSKETGYVIWRHTADVFGSATAIYTNAADTVTYNDTAATVGTLYYYWIIATNAMGSSSESVSDSGYKKLAEVAGLAATDGTSTANVGLTWTDIAGETGYGIWRNTSDNSGTATFLDSEAANATSHTDATAAPGQLYYYWVRATNSTCVTQSDFQASGEDGYRKLATVTGVTASDNTDSSQVVVEWNDITGETGYGIWRWTTDTSNSAIWVGNAAADAVLYNDTSATPAQQYYYWVMGTNSTSASMSAWSASDAGMRKSVDDPASAVITQDGREMVRAVVSTNDAGNPILVLRATAAAVSGTPASSTSYSLNDAIGNATVIYKGTATNFREHVVSAGTTNFYKIYSVESDSFYSPGIIPTGSSITTEVYQAGVSVDTFSYTNVTLSADDFALKSGGANWASTSSWVVTESGGTWSVLTNDTADGRPMFFTAPSNQMALSGNRVFFDANGATRQGDATRTIDPITSGVVYVSAMMAYRYNGTDKWLTMALMNGDTEELEVGKVFGGDKTFSIRVSGANAASSYDMNPYADSTNNWYWAVVKYDFDTDTASAKCFYQGANIPPTEPASWDATWGSLVITNINNIRMKAGNDSNWLGGGLFDELRVSTVWPALIGQPGMVITPSSYDFGDMEFDLTSNTTFWVENTGGDNVPLTVDSLTMGGTNPTNFTLSVGTLGTIYYGQSNSFTVTWDPDVVQGYTGTVYVTNSSAFSPVTISVIGNGIATAATNKPVVSNYVVGVTNQVTDAMVTSGVYSVVVEAFHVRGIASASFDLINGSGVTILDDEPFSSWSSADGETFTLSNATHTGYYPATPSDSYKLWVNLVSSNGLGATNKTYGGVGAGTDMLESFDSAFQSTSAGSYLAGTATNCDLGDWTYAQARWDQTLTNKAPTVRAAGHLTSPSIADGISEIQFSYIFPFSESGAMDVDVAVNGEVVSNITHDAATATLYEFNITGLDYSGASVLSISNNASSDDRMTIDSIKLATYGTGTQMVYQVIDDDDAAPVITSPLVNGATTPAGSAVGPNIAIGSVPGGGFDLDWDVQDTGSGMFAASNHYTLVRSNVVISSGAVTVGSDGDGAGSAISVNATVAKASMIWGNYSVSFAGHDFDPEWVGDISGVSNVYYFVITAPSIGVSPTALDFGTVDKNVTSNLTVVVTNSGNADLVISSFGFAGTGSGYFSAAPDPLTVAPGTASNVVVSFLPTAGGTFDSVVMTLNNNTPDDTVPTVDIEGICYDPTTEDPTVYDFRAEDSAALTNEVTDEAIRTGDVTVGFTLYHVEGMALAGASYDLMYPDGTLAWTNGSFDAMTPVTVDGKDGYEYTAAVPGFTPAVLGIYTARVTAVSSNAYSVTDEALYTPAAGGDGVERILDNFNRDYAADDIGSNWLANINGPTNGNIQVTNQVLQLYGEGGTAGNGRLSVTRDISSRYNPVLTNNSGTLSWGFNFSSGHNSMAGLASGQYGGVFVLGSTSTNVVNGVGNGYAVLIRSNEVALVHFNGLNGNGDVTTIGSVASINANTSMGVRVTLDTATDTWNLYAEEWGGNSPASFGNPMTVTDLITSTVDSTYLTTESLDYVGCLWNHGSAAPNESYSAIFDDVYVPYILETSLLMNFTVVDEDEAGPTHSSFNVENQSHTIGSVDPGGLNVTGLVQDVNGLYAGTSNIWFLYSNATQVATGSMTMTPNTDGAGSNTAAALSCNISFSDVDAETFTGFVFRVVSTDYDTDRPGDSLSTTNDYRFFIIPSDIPVPHTFVATEDGMEMVEMTWNKNGASEVVILRGTNTMAPSTLLIPGTAYNVNDAGPDDTVVWYRGTDSFGEVTVPQNSSNYFRIFGAVSTFYSTTYAEPTNYPAVSLQYEAGEIVDAFAYTNLMTLGDNNLDTGQGWEGTWFGDTNLWVVEDTNLMHGTTDYPTPYANKIYWHDTNSYFANSATITRKLSTINGGRVFIAFMMNYLYDGTNKWAGLSLMSGADADVEEVFFGKVNDEVKLAGIADPDDSTTVSAYDLAPGHFQDYMIVGELNPTENTVKMWAFYTNSVIPQDYTNATPIATYSNASLSTATITGIRLGAGSGAGEIPAYSNELGYVYFDEVRVGGTWDEVLNFNFPKAVGFTAGINLNGTNYISDGELSESNKSYDVSYSLYHRTGVTNAFFTIVTNVNNAIGLYPTNIPLLLDPTDAEDQYRSFTNMVTNRLDPSDVVLGTYTSRVWMTAVSGKETNTLFMEGASGADDLFFGEFGEGNNWDKYVEIYNGTGGSIDLSQYLMASQTTVDDKWLTWEHFSRLSPTTYWLGHGETIVILNGGHDGEVSGSDTVNALVTNAMVNAGRDYLFSSNDVLTVSGDDPVMLFHISNTNQWIDSCGIAPGADKYIMRRVEDSDVPREYPLQVDTNEWDFREWDSDRDTVPPYTNFIYTAGVYDRNVGLGGYIMFNVYDDDDDAPLMGTNSALMIGTGPYTSLTEETGTVEVVLTAWNFNGADQATASVPWAGSLLTNGLVTCDPAYTPGAVDFADSGTSENDFFGVIDQSNGGVAELASIGTYYVDGVDEAWIEYEMDLTSASDMVLSWAEAGGTLGFDTARIEWSSDGNTFQTNVLWPSWDPSSGSTYQTRYVNFDGVVTPGLSKIYIRIVLGPDYGGASGYYRMDNVQLNGYPQEFIVTDGEIADSGYKLQFEGNMYDTNSGLNKALATMTLATNDGVRVPGNDHGDGIVETNTLWWELDVTTSSLTEFVNDSLTGNGMSIDVNVPDLDADRVGDTSWLNGNFGRLRVNDDDASRPRMALDTMKPESSIIAQWQCTNTVSFLPTKSDPTVEVGPMKTKSGGDPTKSPYFGSTPVGGLYYIEAWAWHGGNKAWVMEMTPEADVAITNLSFTSYQHRTNGVTSYRIEHWVDGGQQSILSTNYFVLPAGTPVDPTNWYNQSHGFATNEIVFEAGHLNEIRLYGLGCSNVGARWRILEMTLWQQALTTNGITEVTDEEFTSGAFQMKGSAWDTTSGIASTNNADATKRPMFSLYAPDASAILEDELLDFTAGVADGGATNSAQGAFANDLPQANYTNLMLGEYTGSTTLWDYDNDRTVDDLGILGDISMYVVDNDLAEPSTCGVVRVNGTVVPGAAPTRLEASWTNTPNFLVSLDSLPEDQDPGAGYSDKQRGMSGIGEYRVTATDVSAMTPSNRANYGTPYPMAATNGALANYGFEMTIAGSGWTLDGNCSSQSILDDSALVKEGTNSLKITNGGTAYQEIEFVNTAATAPQIAVSGWYQASVSGTFRIEAFATNDLVTPVATRDVNLGAAASWTAFNIDPAEALGDGTVEVLKISLIDGGENTSYWDDIRLSVDIGANLPSMNFTAGTANQGLDAQYIFPVDADNNRSGDRMAGPASPFYIAYDVTPPTVVSMGAGGTNASTLTVDDPTTQFDLGWSTVNVGPDDDGHVNHPTGLPADRDLLSPWQSYKIYYGTFDPLDVPIGDLPSGATGYIYTNFIANSSYLAWSSVTADTTILDPSAASYQPDYDAITNLTQGSIRLYDLDFDEDYAVVVVGVDKAGNEGPAGVSSWATNNTIRFALTRGTTMAKSNALVAFPSAPTLANTNTDTTAALYWIAAGPTNAEGIYTSVSKEYDLIHWDSDSFQERTNNDWQLLGTVQTNWFVDSGGQFRGRGNLRFYRASYKGRWKRTNTVGEAQNPLVSEEVYAMHNAVLSGGANYVALHGRPYTNSFEAVFGGTETFPGGATALPASGSTVIEFFSAGTNAPSSDQFWLNTSGRWIHGGSDITTNIQAADFFNRGFSISLPDPLPADYITTTAFDYALVGSNGAPVSVDAMVWSPIMKVPTNAFSQVISTGSSGTRPDPDVMVYNVAALRLPVSAHPSDMNLLVSGFVNGEKGVSDEIYTMNTATKSVLKGSTIYCDGSGTWRYMTTDALVPPGYFKPNDVIVIISRNHVGDGSWTWTYAAGHFYDLPNRWMTP